MPIYEYVCSRCGRKTEALQRVGDPPLAVCPHCEGELKKVLSAPAFQFKGSGWYVTDYSRKGAGGPKGEGKPEGEKPAAKEAPGSSPAAEKSAAAEKPASKPPSGE